MEHLISLYQLLIKCSLLMHELNGVWVAGFPENECIFTAFKLQVKISYPTLRKEKGISVRETLDFLCHLIYFIGAYIQSSVIKLWISKRFTVSENRFPGIGENSVEIKCLCCLCFPL